MGKPQRPHVLSNRHTNSVWLPRAVLEVVLLYLAVDLEAVSILSFASGAANFLHVADYSQWNIENVRLL